MTSTERTLRAVRAQVQFEVAEAAAQVAHNAARTALAQRQHDAAAQRCATAATELRTAMHRSALDPTLLTGLHRLLQIERGVLGITKIELARASEHELRARDALAAVRNRDRSLERALQADKAKRRSERTSRELLQVDELWLQYAHRSLP